jgi:hypothetical protein
MEQGAGQSLLSNRTNTTYLPFSFDPLTIELHESVEIMPRGGDLWLFVDAMSPHHIIIFFPWDRCVVCC